jgi:AcrR family transcriptional regulator
MIQITQPGSDDPNPASPGAMSHDVLPPSPDLAAKTKRRIPASDANCTSERILDAALDLFLSQGYDATSLRQIAEQLDVTKAALYYHFESKEDILLALHLRLHEFGEGALDSLGDEPMTLELWGQLLDHLLDQMLAQHKLFLMHQRNQAAMEKLHTVEHEAANDDIQNRFRKILLDNRVAERDRVRMAAAFSAALAGLLLVGESFPDPDRAKFGDILRDCIGDILSG